MELRKMEKLLRLYLNRKLGSIPMNMFGLLPFKFDNFLSLSQNTYLQIQKSINIKAKGFYFILFDKLLFNGKYF